MKDELTVSDLDEIIAALNGKKQAIVRRPIETSPGGRTSHRDAYLARRERQDRVEEITRKVRVLKRELQEM